MLPLRAPRHGTVWLPCGGTYIRVAGTNAAPGATFAVLEKALFCTQRCSLSSSSAFHSFFPSLSKTVWFHIVLCAVTGLPGPHCPPAMSLPMAACTPLLLGHRKGEDPALQVLSAQSSMLWGSFVTGKGALIPRANSAALSWGRNAALSLGCPARGGTSRAISKKYKQAAFPDSLSTPGREAAQRRENMCKTKKCGQAGTIKFQYRKWSWCHFNILSGAKNSKLRIKIQCKTPTNSQLILVEKLTFMENMHGNMPEECVVLFLLLILNTLVQRAIPF